MQWPHIMTDLHGLIRNGTNVNLLEPEKLLVSQIPPLARIDGIDTALPYSTIALRRPSMTGLVLLHAVSLELLFLRFDGFVELLLGCSIVSL